MKKDHLLSVRLKAKTSLKSVQKADRLSDYLLLNGKNLNPRKRITNPQGMTNTSINSVLKSKSLDKSLTSQSNSPSPVLHYKIKEKAIEVLSFDAPKLYFAEDQLAILQKFIEKYCSNDQFSIIVMDLKNKAFSIENTSNFKSSTKIKTPIQFFQIKEQPKSTATCKLTSRVHQNTGG